jgi:hypothetical protein
MSENNDAGKDMGASAPPHVAEPASSSTPEDGQPAQGEDPANGQHRELDETVRATQERMDEETSSDLHRQIKLLACFAGFLFSGITVFSKFFGVDLGGDGVFVLIISGLSFLALAPFEKRKIAVDLTTPFKVAFLAFWRSVKNANWKELGLSAVELLRSLFRFGDGLVRVLTIAIAVGGTAICVKYGIKNFHMLPAFLEVWVKRLGPALALIVVIVYPTSIISKRMFLLSMNNLDNTCRKYGLMLYVSVLMLCVCLIALFSGLKIEDLPFLVSSRNNVSFSWEAYPRQILTSLCLIWLIWTIAFGSAILSRFFEIAWRDLPSQTFEGIKVNR